MSAYLREVTPPTAEPLTVGEAMDNSNIELADRHKDEWFVRKIKQARLSAEHFLGFKLTDAVWEYRTDRFANPMPLPVGHVGEIVSIVYIDEDGAEQTLDESIYVFDDNEHAPEILLAWEETWPEIRGERNAVRIRFKSLYSDADSPPPNPVPEDIKGAMGMMIAHWLRNPEAVEVGQVSAIEIPMGAQYLLQPHRLGMGV